MAFVCYNCGVKRKKREFGAIVAEKKICKFCLPYCDYKFIAWLIEFHKRLRAQRVEKVGRERNK